MYKIQKFFMALLLLAVSGTTLAAPTISSVVGTDNSGAFPGAQWTGQPAKANTSAPKYKNQYNKFFILESQGTPYYYWTVYGSGFTNTQGSVWLLDPSSMKPIPGVTIAINNWRDGSISIVPKGPYSFSALANALLAVSLDTTAPTASNARNAMKSVNLVGVIQTRGYGQCTWLVAFMRLFANKSIPPSAFSVTASIPAAGSADSGYQPQIWDALTYNTDHVAIISSNPTITNNADKSVTYSFTLTEMNASWDEAISTSTRTYVLSAPDARGHRTVKSGIGANAFASIVATGYYR